MLVKSASLAALWAALCAAILGAALAGCAMRPPSGTAPAHTDATGEPPAGTPAPHADRATLIVQSATAMLGQPYRFGGAAPGGFDCSGLVAFAAQSAGLSMPRTANEQLRSGVRIGRSDLEAGDLVFMRLAHKELHVGIAIGAGRFIHAPATGGHVRIDSLDARPYSSGFVEARRVVGGPGLSGL
jgi:cell wall-associated NlpC family hydrolase